MRVVAETVVGGVAIAFMKRAWYPVANGKAQCLGRIRQILKADVCRDILGESLFVSIVRIL